MSNGLKVKTEGGSGKMGSGRRNNFRNNNQPQNNTNSHTRNFDEPETAMYIVSHFSLADRYEKVTKEIIRYVIRNLPGGVNPAREMRVGKLPNKLLDTNTK